ncbi:hypothetical protein CFC21_081972 [Triticum aestivum]|uniref:OTU domain-containing protein n=3 Tax=Triticum TaxID=4564 RepID=A0A9R1I4G1_WHEAT|nr:uncharacterized protein LOC123131847 [Triticum aestivum]KAF7077412.1 hypothetical protein CFC21_081968 [Triticum aestivum]KAF7077417.1 hypothetical protein CFC21_081972 [Triticum aestivum]VAI42391.1 unnamed protein product [Triticum turgidum subsp. durum]
MEPPAPGSEPPVEEDRIHEPASNSNSNASSPGAAAPPPPPATPLHLEQAGGGADGSSPATVADPWKGKGIADTPSPPSSASSSSSSSSLDFGAAFGGEVGESSKMGGRKARVRWSRPVVAETREVPNAAAHPLDLDPKLVARQRFIERLIEARAAVDKEEPFDPNTVFEQMVIEQLIQEQAAGEEANRRREQQAAVDKENRRREQQAAVDEGTRRWEQQYNSLRAEEAMYQKEQEKVVVKVRPKQDKLPQVKGKSLWSRVKNKIFCGKVREICSEHVKHQTHPITEVRRYHRLASDEANHLDAYSEYRSVIGDGECFYRSFIFSYLEQVINRQDTHEEQRLLDVVQRLSTQHANLRWNSEFSRSSRAFKDLIKKVMRWKKHGRRNSMESTSSNRKEKLLEFFSKYDTTLDIFIFLRLVVAIEICSHEEVYEPLIPGLRGNYSLEDWCIRRVTPARRFTDHVMMVALATALEVPLTVERVRGGHDPDIYTVPGVLRPRVTLLYSGDHYGIIYPRAPPAENSSHQTS